MDQPKRTKWRKQMKQVRHLRGTETRGCELSFGDYGLQVQEAGWITARQIEAMRVSVSRYVKRGGKLWVKIFPQKPFTKKAAETRQGSGKGNTEYWVAEVRPGRILIEITGVTEQIANEAFKRGGSKLSLSTKFVKRSDYLL